MTTSIRVISSNSKHKQRIKRVSASVSCLQPIACFSRGRGVNHQVWLASNALILKTSTSAKAITLNESRDNLSKTLIRTIYHFESDFYMEVV